MKAALFSILILFFAIHLQASEKPFQRFSALPVLAYSEETSLQYGAMLLLFFKPVEGGTQVSTIDLVALGSLENQYQLRTKPHFYFLGDKLFMPSEFSISKWCGSIYERSAEGSFDPLDDYENFHFYGKLPFEMNFGIPNSLPVRYGLVFETDYRENTLDSAWQISKRFQDGFLLALVILWRMILEIILIGQRVVFTLTLKKIFISETFHFIAKNSISELTSQSFGTQHFPLARFGNKVAVLPFRLTTYRGQMVPPHSAALIRTFGMILKR